MTYAPAALAFAAALLGVAAFRRMEQAWPAIAAAALAAGWMAASPSPRAWLSPRGLPEHLVLPAVVTGLAVLAARLLWPKAGRWLMAVALGFGTWWVAGAAAARGEFWRVGFAILLAASLLRLVGGGTARGAAAAGLTVWIGTLTAGAPGTWCIVASVLFAAVGGLALVRPEAAVPAGLVATGIVALDLGTGRAMQGRIGLMDLVCVAAVGAAWMLDRIEARLPGLPRGMAPARAALACGLTALAGVAVAWVVLRVIR